VDKKVERRVAVGDEGKEHVRIDNDDTDDSKRDELRETDDIRENGSNKSMGE